ncbi:MAG TPA: hypothetical protein VLJ60_06295, partial [bacterium]|nr:hypothetical protein [bacterium]
MKTFISIFQRTGKWKFFAGVDIRKVPAYSVVFFPIQPYHLFCGFAGVLAIKRGVSPAVAEPVDELDRQFQEIKEKDISLLLSDALSSVEYLNGTHALEEIAKSAFRLKEDTSFQNIFFQPEKIRSLSSLLNSMKDFFSKEEKALEEKANRFPSSDMEIINSKHVLLKDIIWSIEKDILENIAKIVQLSGLDQTDAITPEALKKYKNLNFVLNNLDRLEVRGRDSAGIQISFTLRDNESMESVIKSLIDKGLYDDFQKRALPKDMANGAILMPSFPCNGRHTLSFVYKISSIIGELGHNVRELRKYIAADKIFHEISNAEAVFQISLGHTRWASVGSITDEN